jgi:hypothetical protein
MQEIGAHVERLEVKIDNIEQWQHAINKGDVEFNGIATK